MGRHAAPAGPEGRETRRRLQGTRRRRRYPGGVWRYVTSGMAFAAAGGFMETVHEPRYLAPVLLVIGALLPLALLDASGTVIANFLGGRRERRLLPPRPRVAYLGAALGWAVIGVACGLAAAAGHPRPSTWLVWATVISGGAMAMLIGRALPAELGAGGRNLLRRPRGVVLRAE